MLAASEKQGYVCLAKVCLAHVNTSQACTDIVTMQTNHGFIAVAALVLPAQAWLMWGYVCKTSELSLTMGFSLVRSCEVSVVSREPWDGWAARAGPGVGGWGDKHRAGTTPRGGLERGGPLLGTGGAPRSAPSRDIFSMCSFPFAHFRHEVMR